MHRIVEDRRPRRLVPYGSEGFGTQSQQMDARLYSFSRRTEIDSYHGAVLIEDIGVGDMVYTKDEGFQKVLWVGSRELSPNDGFPMVRFAENSIGNKQSIKVLASHLFMMSHAAAREIFGVEELLIEARHLVNGHEIHFDTPDKDKYFQILFDRHQIVFANGIPSASLYLNSRLLSRCDDVCSGEWLDALPILNDTLMNSFGSTARLVLREHDVHTLRSRGPFVCKGGVVM